VPATAPAIILFKRHMGINMHKHLEALGGVETPSLKDFWSWVKSAFTVSYQDEIHSYLAESTDHCDLEHRMRALAQRGML
jgi:hypothetical protein